MPRMLPWPLGVIRHAGRFGRPCQPKRNGRFDQFALGGTRSDRYINRTMGRNKGKMLGVCSFAFGNDRSEARDV